MEQERIKYFINICLMFFLLSIQSCRYEPKLNYTDLFLDKQLLSSSIPGPYLALLVKNKTQINLMICPSYYLKNYMLRYDNFNHESYERALINSIERNVPLEVNDSLYSALKSYNLFVYHNNGIDSLFDIYNNDVIKMLDQVFCYKELYYGNQVIKNPKDAAWNETEYGYNYLIYLLFQYGFYVTQEEGGLYLIDKDSKGYNINVKTISP